MSVLAGRAPAHTPRVIAVCSVGVLVAFLVQTALLPAVGLPALIPFTFATVAVLGVSLGSRAAAITGFLAGLLVDLTGVGILGVGALAGCLLGAAAGQVRTDRWWFSGVPSVTALVIAAWLGTTVLDAVLSQVPLIVGAGWLWGALGAAVSVALLMPLRGWLRSVVR